MKYINLLLLLLLAFSACKKGNPFENKAPDTHIFLDEIKLSGTNRLQSVIRLHWSGEDQDGYITSYELAINQGAWAPVVVQDSIFNFDIPIGSDTTDVFFQVRAIDNEDLVDPSPAELLVPIKNSQPTARFDTTKLLADTVFSVFSMLWEVDDLDGFENLDSLFLKINDGDWYAMPSHINFASIIPTAADVNGQQEALVVQGPGSHPSPLKIKGLKVGDDNQLYLKARDIAGSFSKIDSSKIFFIRQQRSDLLVIDDHSSASPDDIYLPILDQVYSGYDHLVLAQNIPSFWDPTFGLMLNLYDKVLWYSDGDENSDFGEQLLLEVSANQLQLYLNQGGKLFAIAKLPSVFVHDDRNGISPIFGFSPMDSLPSNFGQARIPIDSLVEATAAFAADFPTLKSSAFISGADPFYPKDPNARVYEAHISVGGGGTWAGPQTIGGLSRFSNGEVNQFFFSVELHRLNGNPTALKDLFDQILNQEFSW